MTPSIVEYERFLAARQKAVRHAGRCIIARLLAGEGLGSIVNDDGHVNGLDHDAGAVILLSGAAHKRKIAALKALRALKAA